MTDTPASPAALAAMISLLDDPNEKVSGPAAEALRGVGEAALESLREALPGSQGARRERIEALIRELAARSVVAELEILLRRAPDLERGMLLLGRLVDPEGPLDEVGATLDRWAALCRDEVQAAAGDPRTQVEVLRRVLVDEVGLRPAEPGRCTPDQALLHGVTSTQAGIPLALCSAWLLLARRLDVPLVGVNMPGHFLLRIELPRVGASEAEVQLLDAAAGGLLVHADPWRQRLRSMGFTDDLRLLDADDRAMLERSLYNLMNLGGAGQRTHLTHLMELLASLRSSDPSAGPSRRP